MIEWKSTYQNLHSNESMRYNNVLKAITNHLTNEVYVLSDHFVNRLIFSGSIVELMYTSGVYNNDFDIRNENNTLVTCGWDQSYNPPLKLSSLNNMEFLWVKSSLDTSELTKQWVQDRVVSKYRCEILCNAADNYKFVTFFGEYIATLSSENKLLIVDHWGQDKQMLTLDKDDIIAIGSGLNFIFVCYHHSLVRLNLNGEVEVIYKSNSKISQLVVINDEEQILCLGYEIIYLKNNTQIWSKKVPFPVKTTHYDKKNNILFFATQSERVGALNLDGIILLDDEVKESVRAITIVNKSQHILFICKNMDIHVYENLKNTPSKNNDSYLDFVIQGNKLESSTGQNLKKIYLLVIPKRMLKSLKKLRKHYVLQESKYGETK